MKKLLYLIIILSCFSCKPGTKNTNTEAAGKAVVASEMVETTVNIGGMHCEMCVASILKGVNELEGVTSVEVSLSDSSAIVSYDVAKLNVTDIEKVIEKRGYSVKK